MSNDKQTDLVFYPAGRCILVKSPRTLVLQIKPYQAYPVNADGYRTLEVLGDGASLEELERKMGIKSKKEVEMLFSFLQNAVAAGILTRDTHQAGVLRVKTLKVSPPLERIFLEVTTRCNLHCAHCYMSATAAPREDRELTYDEIVQIIQRADELGVYRFDFTGGEMFVRKDMHDLLKAAYDAFMIVNIFINGTLLTEERCAFLAGFGNIRTAFVSLDDVKEEVHDTFRGSKGAFRRTVEGINRLREHGIRVVVNITIWKQNATRIIEIADFCREDLGVECRIAPIVYVGRGKCFEVDDAPVEDVVAAMKKVIGSRQQLTLGYCGDSDWEERNIPGCGVGHRMLYIRSNGEICLCPTLSSRESPEFELGVIGKDDIGTVWEKSETLQHFRTTHCRRQDCIHLSICRGGCRSRAFLQSNDLFAEDSLTCAYFGVVRDK